MSWILSGCAFEAGAEVDPGVADGDIAMEQQEFSGAWVYSWTDNEDSYVDIGSAGEHTCFLSGVSGYLGGTDNVNRGVSVTQVGQAYRLRVDTGGGKWVRGEAVCVSGYAGRRWPVGGWLGNSPTIVAPVTANRRCFLNKVIAAGGAFRSAQDTVRVWSDGVNWLIGKSQADGMVNAEAICLDVTQDHGSWSYFANPGGTYVGAMASNTNPSGVVCGLTEAKGAFLTSAGGDGISIGYNSGLARWEMTVKNGKQGWGNCIR